MEIIKEKNRGWSVHYSNELDDYAYFLFITKNEFTFANQLGFIVHKNDYLEYYDNAKLILRKEKIEKLRYGNR